MQADCDFLLPLQEQEETETGTDSCLKSRKELPAGQGRNREQSARSVRKPE